MLQRAPIISLLRVCFETEVREMLSCSADSGSVIMYSQKVCNGGFAFGIERSRVRTPVRMDGFRNSSIACNLCDGSTLQNGHGEIVEDVVHLGGSFRL